MVSSSYTSEIKSNSDKANNHITLKLCLNFINCGVIFIPSANNQKFCCKECREQYNHDKDMEILKCSYCGKTFKQSHGNEIYCSDYCSHQGKLDKTSESDNRKKNRDNINKGLSLQQETQKYTTLPKGFNQIDDPKNLGESHLKQTPKKDNDGNIDFDKELKAILNEKSRLRL